MTRPDRAHHSHPPAVQAAASAAARQQRWLWRLALPLAGAALFAASSLARAQTLEPGLWEVNQKIGGSPQLNEQMAQMQRQMAAMPPEQRKMMESMMAQNGVGLAPGSGGAMAIRICMTREMVSRNEVVPQEGDCKTTLGARTGNTQKMSFVCTRPQASGEGQITFTSARAYSSTMTVTQSQGGKTEKVTMDSQGKWLSADCGNIKPPAR